METLIALNALLRFHSSNFLNLHWNAAGLDFDDAHKDISSGYYELCDKYIDSTAEMSVRLGGNPMNFTEVAEFAADAGWSEVDSSALYTREDIVANSHQLLSEIIDSICDCLDDPTIQLTANAGIKSDLESMLEEFDIQFRYINKRRINNFR